MRITLRRAKILGEKAIAAATNWDYEAVETISVYAPALADPQAPEIAQAIIIEARRKLRDKHTLSLALIAAHYAIRDLLAAANQAHGVNAYLNRKAKLTADEASIKALRKAITPKTRGDRADPSVTVALHKAAALRAQPRDSYMSERDTVQIALFDESEVAQLDRQLNQIDAARALISDALFATNVNNTITLDATTVATLRRADLLSEDEHEIV